MSEAEGLPRIGENAPDFSAVTTLSQDFGFSVWQEQDWVVFFSHPADFTPVSTTELVEFARRHETSRRKASSYSASVWTAFMPIWLAREYQGENWA